MNKFLVLFEKSTTGYGAYAPDRRVAWPLAVPSKRRDNEWRRRWKCILPQCAKTAIQFPSPRISNSWKRSKRIPLPSLGYCSVQL